VVFYYLGASGIWPDKTDGLWWECPDKRRATITNHKNINHNSTDLPQMEWKILLKLIEYKYIPSL
jgi:hypothetical protein